jgi:glucokinase
MWGAASCRAWGDYFERSPFRRRFEERGRFSEYVAAIPTYVITAEEATFKGASAILEAQLKKLHGSGDTILAQVRRAKAQLTPRRTARGRTSAERARARCSLTQSPRLPRPPASASPP